MEELRNYLLTEINKTYTNIIEITQVSENQIEISLPLFFNNGNIIQIIIEKNEENLILKNNNYNHIENSLENYIFSYDLIKNYLLNKKKFVELKKEILSNNGIKVSLNQELEIKSTDKNEINNIIFVYSFNVIKYYNYIYDYIIENFSSEKKTSIFKEDIKKFVKIYNQKNKKNLTKIENTNLISSYNDYYTDKDLILTGANSKVHFLEAITDIENMLNEINKNIEILIKKGEISEEYAKKVLVSKSKLKKANVSYI